MAQLGQVRATSTGEGTPEDNANAAVETGAVTSAPGAAEAGAVTPAPGAAVPAVASAALTPAAAKALTRDKMYSFEAEIVRAKEMAGISGR